LSAAWGEGRRWGTIGGRGGVEGRDCWGMVLLGGGVDGQCGADRERDGGRAGRRGVGTEGGTSRDGAGRCSDGSRSVDTPGPSASPRTHRSAELRRERAVPAPPGARTDRAATPRRGERGATADDTTARRAPWAGQE